MSPRARQEARRRRLVTGSAIVTLIAVVLGFSLKYEGVATADVTLHDGGVWVVRSDDALVGRLNYMARALDATVAGNSTRLDVIQDGNDVFVHDLSNSTMESIDTAAVGFDGLTTDLPDGASIWLRLSTMSVSEPQQGQWWVADPTSIGYALATEPTAILGEGGMSIITSAGTAIGFNVEEGTYHRWTRDDRMAGEDFETSALAASGFDPDHFQLSAAGERIVGLEQSETATTLYVEGQSPIDLTDHVSPEAPVMLQEPSASTDVIALATEEAVLVVAADGSLQVREERAPAAGTPARPVNVRECIHAAWAGYNSTYGRLCGDEATMEELPESRSASTLKFRVNRDLVVLNDTGTGQSWLFDGVIVLVDNWDEAMPAEGDDEGAEENNPINLPETAPAERTLQNRPPIAESDDFGVRPGASVVLPVLINDSDPDGDLLTASILGEIPPEFGELQVIQDGRALQIQTAGTATGTVSFDYRVEDGRGGEDTGTVTLEAVTPGTNRSPEQVRVPSITMTEASTVPLYVLGDIVDPDGDPVYVCNATSTDGMEVTTDPSGYIRITDGGGRTGDKSVQLWLSDGTSDCESIGQVQVVVEPPGSSAPQPVFDHERAFVGQPISVSPTINDISPTGSPLNLNHVSDSEGAVINRHLGAGRFEFVAEEIGVHYLEYTVSDDNGASAIGLVRIDVVEPQSGDPTAVPDTALLRPQDSQRVDVLSNDTDPAGSVLAIQHVEVPNELEVAVIDHQFLEISARGVLDAPIDFNYSISNGNGVSTSTVTVVPLDANLGELGPQAVPDFGRVRAGDYGSLDVVANDSHPAGRQITLEPELTEVSHEDVLIFTSGNTVRFLAPDEATTITATYSVVDELGNRDSARITISVQEQSDDENQAPMPLDVQARVFAGDRVRIPLTLIGIDPDGDSVSFDGVETSPERGIVVETGPDYLIYEAFTNSAGTDIFTYRVKDRLGSAATASVQVGVVPPALQNRPPTAQADQLHVRPGRTVEFDPLSNDHDPDGDNLSYQSEPFTSPDLPVEIVGGRVQVTAPESEGVHHFQYHITDGRSGYATGHVMVVVDEEAPLLPPIAKDDVIPIDQIVGQTTLTVDVLENDYDPDGSNDDISVSLPLRDLDASVSGRSVVVMVKDERQIVPYQATDSEGLSTYAFIDVPGLAEAGPTLRTNVIGLRVNSGEGIQIPLADHVISPRQVPVVLVPDARVSATNSDGSELFVNPSTLFYRSPADYVGPASITFTVRDDAPEAGPEATLTLPITVVGDQVQPPQVQGALVDVPVGGEAVEVDLHTLTRHEDLGSIDYSITEPPGAQVSLVDGRIVRVGLPASATSGGTYPIEFTADDGVNEPVSAVITATAVSSTNELMVAIDDSAGALVAGQSRSISVLDNDVNPFPDQPLQLLEARVVTGRGTASVAGNRVVLTPAADYVGTFEVVYVAVDATGEAGRRDSAVVRGTVQGTPLQMNPPRVIQVGDGIVVVEFTPPTDSGSPIQEYIVRWGSGSQSCATTVCTITGLTNGQSYQFTVAARNGVGESPASNPSGAATPDRVPDRMPAPNLTATDQTVTATWAAASGGGTIAGYQVDITPQAAGSAQQRVSGTEAVFSRLINGTEYRARVRAVNASGETGEWSPWSLVATPFGVPHQPSAPTADRQGSPGAWLANVSWTVPGNNGAPLTSTSLRVYRDGALIETISLGPTVTSHQYNLDDQHSYTFQVVVHNRAGASASSASSVVVQGFGAPGTPGAVSAVVVAGQQQVDVSFNAPSGNGQAITHYEYRLFTGGSFTTGLQMPASRRIDTGVPHGNDIRVSVRACHDVCGNWSDLSNTVSTFGPPARPALEAQPISSNQVRYTWNTPGSSNGATNSHVRVYINGSQVGGQQALSDTGVFVATPGSRVIVEVEAVNTHGVVGPRARSEVTLELAQVTLNGFQFTGSRNHLCHGGGLRCSDIRIDVSSSVAGHYTYSTHVRGGNGAPGCPVEATLNSSSTRSFGPGGTGWFRPEGGTARIRLDPDCAAANNLEIQVRLNVQGTIVSSNWVRIR